MLGSASQSESRLTASNDIAVDENIQLPKSDEVSVASTSMYII